MKKNLMTFHIFLKALSLSGLSIKWIAVKATDRFKTKIAHFGNQQDAEEWGRAIISLNLLISSEKSMLMEKLKLILK